MKTLKIVGAAAIIALSSVSAQELTESEFDAVDLAKNKTSDLSSLTDEERDLVADEDAIQFLAEFPRPNKKATLDLGKEINTSRLHALRHHLRGNDATFYAVEFRNTLEALASSVGKNPLDQ